MTTKSLVCPVCTGPLSVRLARGRKSGKPFILLVCPVDGRHLRAFVSDRGYLDRVMGAGAAGRGGRTGTTGPEAMSAPPPRPVESMSAEQRPHDATTPVDWAAE